MATAQGVIPKKSDLNETLSGGQSPPPAVEHPPVRLQSTDDQATDDQATDGAEEEKGILDSVPFLVAGVIISVLAMPFLLTMETRRTSEQSEYVERSSKLLPLAQQVAIESDGALQGVDDAFDSLADAVRSFASVLDSLERGGPDLKPLPESLRRQLAPVKELWTAIENQAAGIQERRAALSNTRGQVATAKELAPLLLTRSDEVVEAVIDESGDPGLVNEAARLRALSQRMVNDATIYSGGGSDAAPAVAQIGRDLSQFQGAMARLRSLGGPVTEARLESVDEVFEQMQAAAISLFEDAADVFEARSASRSIAAATGELAGILPEFVGTIRDTRHAGIVIYLPWLAAGSAVLFLLLLARALADNARDRAALGARRNRETQEAIQKLLDDMGGLAEGDLTIEAEESDRITGAIAGSVNIAVKEMRELVTRINDAAERVAGEARTASATAQALLAASSKHASQIAGTAESVQSLSVSLEDMSAATVRSADAARSSTAVAKKGGEAVRATIRGLDGMQGRIRETSRCIGRLGESSRQITQIVDLIEDIAERSSMLLLNAAIQTATDGDPARDFTAVTNEVQRLADKSAQATDQINRLVGQIQSDTSEASTSMDFATQSVVEGTRVADASEQALNEIEIESERISELIESMAAGIRGQSESVNDISANMTFMRDVTKNTAQNARYTAESIAKLATLAEDLERSVAGFRIMDGRE